MADIELIFALIKIIIFGIIILLALIYLLTILFISRFHHSIHILTLNICFAMVCSASYWMGYFIMFTYYIEYLFTEKTCMFLFYMQSISTCEIPFAFVTLTINRIYSIVYSTKPFIKTKIFVAICITSQWIVVCLVSLPFALNIEPYCDLPRWLSIYTIIIAIIIPALITLVFNLLIFKHVHSSSRRIRPQNETTQGNVIMNQQQQQQSKISRRDIYLLGHTIFMFSVFIIGWTPIFTLVAVDYSYSVNAIIYTILQVLAVISSFACIVDLFLYNHELRRYIKQKILSCF